MMRQLLRSQLLLLLLLLLACRAAEAQASIRRYRLIKGQCLSEALSDWKLPRSSASLFDCIVSSRTYDLRVVGLVQRNRLNSSCALFRFGQVCHLLGLINNSSSIGPTGLADCEATIDSEYDAIAANQHFSAVWVADRGPALENLVCGSEGPRNPMRSVDVAWTNDGAVMNGISSRLWVNESAGLDFTGSYTMLLHLRRTPRNSNCFIETASCPAYGEGSVTDHFWEFSELAGVSRSLYLYPGMRKFQTGPVLPSSSQQFFIAAVTFDRPASQARFFLDYAFLSAAQYVTVTNVAINEAGVCIRVGYRIGNWLNGAVKAVALANSALTEEQIRQLLQLR